MRIISKVEINYFRSTYSIDLKRTNDLNILVGENDSGKSNILKALNLFFNNESELGQSFFFQDDLSRKRAEEVRNTKGRATIWIKVHFLNFMNWRSLPSEFAIKKSWNRYYEQPETTFPREVTSTSVARFLNRISFHYIPAVRGRDIFSHFLSLLHDALLDDEKAGLLRSTENLMSTLNDSTSDMSDRIKEGVGIESNVQPPTNLRVLFNALDFATGYDDHSIPLQKRGDGIQSRHIPYILDFIASHTKKHHIWAYEEPETSLELGPAFELAKQFSQEFCRDNQIFTTTHSPAFYDLSDESVSKWLVHQKNLGSGKETKVEKVTSEDLIDGQLGVASLVADRAREAYMQIENLRASVDRLDSELAGHNTPHVIVEGITDKTIMEAAFQKLYPGRDLPYNFIHADGASNIPPYIKSTKTLSNDPVHPVIGLFDRDNEGRKQIGNFSRSPAAHNTDFLAVSLSKKLYVGLLPFPSELSDIQDRIREGEGVDVSLPIPIEFMFPSHVIRDALTAGELHLEDRVAKASDTELMKNINITNQYSEYLEDDFLYLAKKVDKSYKTRFSNWVSDQEAESFENFRPLFEQLDRLIGREEQ